MRRIMAWMFMSLDGVVEAPNEWTGRYFTDDLAQALGESMTASEAMVLGRVTYQEFVPFWADKTGDEDPTAAHMSKPKLVVSRTLDSVDEWPNSRLVTLAELREIRRGSGRDIAAVGSATLVRSLLGERLLDELWLFVFPVMLGSGKRLYPDGSGRVPLTLTASKTFRSGVLSLRYAPESEEK